MCLVIYIIKIRIFIINRGIFSLVECNIIFIDVFTAADGRFAVRVTNSEKRWNEACSVKATDTLEHRGFATFEYFQRQHLLLADEREYQWLMTRLNSSPPRPTNIELLRLFWGVSIRKYKNLKEMSDFLKRGRRKEEEGFEWKQRGKSGEEQVKKRKNCRVGRDEQHGEISRSEYKSPIFPGGFIFLNLTLPKRVSWIIRETWGIFRPLPVTRFSQRSKRNAHTAVYTFPPPFPPPLHFFFLLFLFFFFFSRGGNGGSWRSKKSVWRVCISRGWKKRCAINSRLPDKIRGWGDI